MPTPRKAVVLLSGGLDSTTVLAIAQDRGFEPFALTIRYGQRHEHEIEAASGVAERFNVPEHLVMNIDLGLMGGSALTTDATVPKERTKEQMADAIPSTYVPARNTIFLSVALGWAEVLGAEDIFIGVNALDYSGYPDCRPEYIHAFQQMADLATKAGVEGRQRLTIHTPLIDKTKAQIISTGLALGVDYGMTSTCYDPTVAGEACGVCDACQLRRRGFEEAGVVDPVSYVREPSS